ncbi:MAG: phage holin family protein [Candidatus Levybacteria bacterium]|nr:phage holin family protein [Candidatus Levybacteria bacterium]
MKSLLRNIVIDAFSLFAVSQILSGVKIFGGVPTLIFGGVVLAFLTMLLRPILSFITFPLSFLTFGTVNFLINALILYLLTIFVSQIKVSAFVFDGLSFIGFVIPKIAFNGLFAFIVSAFLLSLIISFINWLIK